MSNHEVSFLNFLKFMTLTILATFKNVVIVPVDYQFFVTTSKSGTNL